MSCSNELTIFNVYPIDLVPITELKTEDFESITKPLVEKVSFEQQYNSRQSSNYPLRGQVGYSHTVFIDEPYDEYVCFVYSF
jgi:hypothetical protein